MLRKPGGYEQLIICLEQNHFVFEYFLVSERRAIRNLDNVPVIINSFSLFQYDFELT